MSRHSSQMIFTQTYLYAIIISCKYRNWPCLIDIYKAINITHRFIHLTSYLSNWELLFICVCIMAMCNSTNIVMFLLRLSALLLSHLWHCESKTFHLGVLFPWQGFLPVGSKGGGGGGVNLAVDEINNNTKSAFPMLQSGHHRFKLQLGWYTVWRRSRITSYKWHVIRGWLSTRRCFHRSRM